MTSSTRTLFILTLITLATLSRLLPHPVNFTPLLAVALFTGRSLGHLGAGMSLVWVSMLVIDVPRLWQLHQAGSQLGPLGALLFVTGVVYATIALLTWGAHRTQRYRGIGSQLLASLAAAATFFLITNFASWLAYYESSLSGLISCFTAAIPYFKNTWFSTLIYSGALSACLTLFDRYAAGKERSLVPTEN